MSLRPNIAGKQKGQNQIFLIGLTITSVITLCIYTLRKLIFIPFDPWQAFFIFLLLGSITLPGTIVLDTVYKNNPRLGAFVIAVAVLIPLCMSKMVRTSYAYRLQLLEQEATSVKDSVRSLKGYEERLSDNAKSSKIRNIPVIAAALLHLDRKDSARRLLIKKIGIEACRPHGFDPGELVPVLLSIPGKKAFQAMAGIYYTGSIKGRECIVQGFNTFLRPEKSGWMKKFDIDQKNLKERIPDIAKWISRETPRAKGRQSAFLARLAADLPAEFCGDTILKILETCIPGKQENIYSKSFFKLTSKQAQRRALTKNLLKKNRHLENSLRNAQASRLLEAIPEKAFSNLRNNKRLQKIFETIIREGKDGAVEAVRIVKNIGWKQLSPVITATLWDSSAKFNQNRELCLKSAEAYMELQEGKKDFLVFNSLLFGKKSEFQGLLLSMMGKVDLKQTIDIIKGFSKKNILSADNDFLHACSLNILAENTPRDAENLSEKILLSNLTSQYLKKRAAITLVALKAKTKIASLEKCVLSTELNFDSQTRSYLAQALKQLKQG